MKKKILICGGHPAPALATIEYLQTKNTYEVVYVGKKHQLPGDTNLSWEYQQIQKLGLPFYNLSTGKLQRNFTLNSITHLFRIPFGLAKALFLIKKIKPDIVVSFGGYLAVPLVFWAKMWGIPTLTHEQTLKVGLANKIMGKFVDTFCVSWKETLSQISHKHLILTGNPLRSDIAKGLQPLLIDGDLQKTPIVYITGGSLGSHFINTLLKDIAKTLLTDFILIHQAGATSEYNDYNELNNIRDSLPKYLQERYFLYKYIEAGELGWTLKHAVLVVGRAGANTITEILFCHTPAILIPLPYSGQDEQKENALTLSRLGVAKVLDQSSLTAEKLLYTIRLVYKNRYAYLKNFTPNVDGLVNLPSASLIVQEIEKLLLK